MKKKYNKFMIYKEIYVGFVIKKLSKNENRNLKINSI